MLLVTIIRCRFLGATTQEIVKALLISVGANAILLTLTVLFAVSLSKSSVENFYKIVLAFSLGGLPEMHLIALSLNTDVAFVATHHLFRVI